MHLRIALIFICLVTINVPASTPDLRPYCKKPADPFNVTTMGPGTHPLELGSSASALSNDAAIAFWNPALPGDMTHYSLSGACYLNNPNSDFFKLGMVYPLPYKGAISVSLLQHSLAEDAFIQKEKSFIPDSPHNLARLAISYSQTVRPGVNIGLSVSRTRYRFRYTLQHEWFPYGNLTDNNDHRPYVAQYTTKAICTGLDFGVALSSPFRTPFLNDLRMGFVIQSYYFLATPATLPTILHIGLMKPFTYGFNSFKALIDASWNFTRIQFQPGIEYSLDERYAIRLGSSRGILVCGCGFRFDKFQFDVSYHNSPYFSAINERAAISISYSFGEIDRAKNKDLREKSISQKNKKLIKKVLQYRDRDRFQRNMDKGQYLYEKGKYNEALISFQAALAIYPESRSAQMWLERTREKIDDDE